MYNGKRLKDDDLKKANGGSIINIPDCPSFELNPSRDMSSKIEKEKMDWTYDCRDCIRWQGPEGPCKLGL